MILDSLLHKKSIIFFEEYSEEKYRLNVQSVKSGGKNESFLCLMLDKYMKSMVSNSQVLVKEGQPAERLDFSALEC